MSWNDPIWRQWTERVLEEMLPKLSQSAINVSIAPGDEGDVKFWVELGASIMLDKPIIVVVEPGREVPGKLRQVADRIVAIDLSTEDGQKQLTEAIVLTLAEIEIEGR